MIDTCRRGPHFPASTAAQRSSPSSWSENQVGDGQGLDPAQRSAAEPGGGGAVVLGLVVGWVGWLVRARARITSV
jgi:hypothetical protein